MAGLVILSGKLSIMLLWPVTCIATPLGIPSIVSLAVSGFPLWPEKSRANCCCFTACPSNLLPCSLLQSLHVSTRSLPPSASGGTCSTVNCLVVNSSIVRPSRQSGQTYQSSPVGKTSSNPRSAPLHAGTSTPVEPFDVLLLYHSQRFSDRCGDRQPILSPAAGPITYRPPADDHARRTRLGHRPELLTRIAPAASAILNPWQPSSSRYHREKTCSNSPRRPWTTPMISLADARLLAAGSFPAPTLSPLWPARSWARNTNACAPYEWPLC